MSETKQVSVAYHPSNQEEALVIQSYLSKAGYELTHLKSSLYKEPGGFSSAIIKTQNPGILLISDNFLRSEDCLYSLFEVYKEVKNERDFEVIICNGKIGDRESSEEIQTSFKKLSGVIKYLNFWQNKYLEARSKKRSIVEREKEDFGSYLRIIRSISTQVGDFLKTINESNPLEFNELANTNFEGFFIRMNDTKGFELYLQNLAAEAALELEENTPTIEEEAKEEKHSIPFENLISNVIFKTPDEIIEEIEFEENGGIVEFDDDHIEDLDILIQNPDKEMQEQQRIAEILTAAQTHLKNGSQAEGLKILKDGVDSFPKNTILRYSYGSSLARYAGSLNLAKFHLKENLSLDPQHTKTLFLLGKMAELEGEHQTAINFFKGVVDFQPNFPDANFRMGLLMMINDSEDLKKIKKCFKKELEINPNHIEATYRLGTLLAENTDKAEKAIGYFQKVIELKPNHQFVNYDIALLYYKIGEMEKAKLYYDKACNVNPELKTEDNDIAFGIRKVVKRIKKTKASLPIVKVKESVSPVILASEAVETKTILITGATSGIGRAIAEIFANQGNVKLILTGRRKDRLENLKSIFEKKGVTSLLLNFDVRKIEEVEKAVESIPKEWKEIDILVNNAGLAKGFEPIHEGQLEHWETMIDTNFKGLLYMTRLISPFMVKNNSGHIINICSIAGKEVYPNGGVYCATKHAVDALTKGMRIDLHKYNIRVSQIAPGHVEETEFAEVRYDGDKTRAKIYQDFKPVTSKDVAEVVHFVATRPAHVNIQDVLVMGTQQASATIIDRSGRK